jgi:hypothetical protein
MTGLRYAQVLFKKGFIVYLFYESDTASFG